MENAVRLRWVGFGLALLGCGPEIGVDDGGGSDGGSDDGSEPSTGEESEGESGTTSASVPGCGDGIVDAGEDCDDGNRIDGDGCNVDCAPSGRLRWFRQLDAGPSDVGQHIDIAPDGSIAIAGVRTLSEDSAAFPFAAAFDPAGELLWDADLLFGRMYVGGVIAGEGGTARVAVYEDGHVPMVVVVDAGEIVDLIVVTQPELSFGAITIARFADHGLAIGGHNEPGQPWVARFEEPTNLAWTVPFTDVLDGDVRQLAALEGDMIALVEDHGHDGYLLTRIAGDGVRLWTVLIGCSGPISAATTGIDVLGGPSTMCGVTPDGELTSDVFTAYLEGTPYDVDAVTDGDLLAVTAPSTSVVTVARLDPVAGRLWRTEVTDVAEFLLPFRGAVARDGSSAVTGMLADGESSDAFVFALTP